MGTKSYLFDPDLLWLSQAPQGWQEKIKTDIYDKLIDILTDEWIHGFYILDLKEKWGNLRLYYSLEAAPPEIYDEVERLIDSEENKFNHICVKCGKPTNHFTTGYILPICEKCDIK